jgi:hypothetical protein
MTNAEFNPTPVTAITILKTSVNTVKFCVAPNSTMFLASEELRPVIQTDVIINPGRTLKA